MEEDCLKLKCGNNYLISEVLICFDFSVFLKCMN